MIETELARDLAAIWCGCVAGLWFGRSLCPYDNVRGEAVLVVVSATVGMAFFWMMVNTCKQLFW